MLSSCFGESLSITFPEIEVILIKLLFEITAKLEPSWIESKYALIADSTLGVISAVVDPLD